jgi:hypothetical protein
MFRSQEQGKYKLVVYTTDSGLNNKRTDPLTSSTVIHITIGDVNEAPSLGHRDSYYVPEGNII